MDDWRRTDRQRRIASLAEQLSDRAWVDLPHIERAAIYQATYGLPLSRLEDGYLIDDADVRQRARERRKGAHLPPTYSELTRPRRKPRRR